MSDNTGDVFFSAAAFEKYSKLAHVLDILAAQDEQYEQQQASNNPSNQD